MKLEVHIYLFRKLLMVLLLCLYSHLALAISLIQDAETQKVIEDIAKPIYQAAGLESDGIKIYLVADDELNAFVYGGQNIFIHTGLIKYSSSPDALAGVIAHEVGHILGGHLVQAGKQQEMASIQSIIGFIAGGVLGVAAGSAELGIGAAMGIRGATMNQYLAFNRCQESAADATSAKILKKLHIPSDGIISFLQSISTNERIFYSGGSVYHRTHPVSMSRIQFLQRNVASAQQAAQSNYLMGDIQERFAMVHAKISAFTASKASLTKTLKSCKGAMPLQYGHVIASYRRNKFNEALTGLQNLIVQQPNNPYFHELKGEILFSRGDLDGAIQSYRTAHELELQSLLLTLMYASSLIKAKQNMPEAQELLHQIVLVERDNAQAWQEMAKLYQHHKNQPMVHLCLAFSSYLMSDPVTAQKHIKALKSMESTLDKQQKQWLEDLQSFESNIAQPL